MQLATVQKWIPVDLVSTLPFIPLEGKLIHISTVQMSDTTTDATKNYSL